MCDECIYNKDGFCTHKNRWWENQKENGECKLRKEQNSRA